MKTVALVRLLAGVGMTAKVVFDDGIAKEVSLIAKLQFREGAVPAYNKSSSDPTSWAPFEGHLANDCINVVYVVARAGVQPATFALGVRCSMQLSYRATFG
jgi:hypothetical protein